MHGNPNLELEIERAEGAPRLRIYVAFARGYTSDGAAPTITEDCAGEADLEREVIRLKEELDRALELARAELRGTPPAAREEPTPRAEASKAKPRLDSDLEVRDLMTREVRTLDRNDKISVADELMRLGRFRHAVVLDEQHQLVGVLSQRDIFFSALAWSLGQGEKAHRTALEACAVKQVMRADVVTIAPDAALADAAALMRDRQIGCLPVLDEGALVGILTEGDFLTLLAKR